MAGIPQGKANRDPYEAMASEELYEELKKNGRGAWAYMYNRFLRACRWKEWRLSEEEVEDISAEAVAALIKRIHREDIEEVRDIRGYALWVLRNEVTNHYRRSRPQTPMVSIDEQTVIPDDANLAEMVADMDIAWRVRGAISRLPEKCRGLMEAYLQYLDGVYGTFEEMARVLNKNSKTIYGNIMNCLKRLAESGELRSLT